MEQRAYKRLLAQLEGLTPEQAAEVSARLQEQQAQQSTWRLVEQHLREQGACPRCGAGCIVKFGSSGGTQRYRCNACRRTFTALTGTPFSRLREKDKLLANAECMAAGLSVRKTAETLQVSVKKAFRWRHRFLEFLAQQRPSLMTGVIEADETFFARSFKGQRSGLPRGSKKRGGRPKRKPEASNKTDPSDERVAVLVARQRGTRATLNTVLAGLDAASLTQALRPALSQDAVLSSDGNAAYGVAARELGIEAGYFVAGYHGYGGDGVWHVQNVNAYHQRLKAWMARFHGVATKYLPSYLGWRQLLDRFHDAVTPQQFLFHALRNHYVNV